MIQKLAAHPTAWEHRPHELVAIRAREPLQLEMEAQTLSLSGFDQAPKLAACVQRAFAERSDDQPPALRSQLREVLQQVEAGAMELM
jgi:hypothetical protein